MRLGKAAATNEKRKEGETRYANGSMFGVLTQQTGAEAFACL